MALASRITARHELKSITNKETGKNLFIHTFAQADIKILIDF